ncbi:hypothetical protein EVAR_86559_1 [Eumeta japonica]|uniref:Uncharacterized protein n=1 Tax=Eumeta variegata TaxID=151549 RepID=A0A4C2A1W8_EUMVA|nr:hypothetical protein EVAR_86559_1 [Eumeta japonica]
MVKKRQRQMDREGNERRQRECEVLILAGFPLRETGIVKNVPSTASAGAGWYTLIRRPACTRGAAERPCL